MGQCRFHQYFSYIAVACAPMHAFLEFLQPVLSRILFPSHWMLSHITIVETMDSSERQINPVAVTIINSRKEYWPSRGSNQRPPVRYMRLDSIISDWSKFKAFADDKINVTPKICLRKGRKQCGKRRKCRLPAFFPFPTMFSNGFLYRVIFSRDCVVLMS